MTRPIEEVYRLLAERLWPWDDGLSDEQRESARRHNLDRVGPGEQPIGFSCHCWWSSERHGDNCPEHLCKGKPIRTAPPDLGCGNGMLMVIGAMRELGWEVYLQGWMSNEYLCDFFHVATQSYQGDEEGKHPWEAVARAALAALEAQ